jgi:hypothetical protein
MNVNSSDDYFTLSIYPLLLLSYLASFKFEPCVIMKAELSIVSLFLT